jgi:hypothetical protein
MPEIPPPPPWQCSPQLSPRIIVLVIVLAFVIIMALFGYAPAMTLSLAVAAVAIADGRTPIRHTLDALD